jgi:superfamily II DNA/RNA helicase
MNAVTENRLLQASTFAELGLSAKVLAVIETTGYASPTPIQAQAIPIAVAGRDVLGIAQTGTGKTASFVLPMITRLETGRARARMPRSLILAPTRELAAQCAQSFEKYGQNHKLTVALLIGGMSMDEQIQKLDRGVDVLIATPGRLLDHFSRGRLMLMGVEILVIDEADRMLDMGFIPDIEKICKLLPPRRQTLFFSATMPPEITRLVDQFLTDPVRIEVAKPATTAKTITQRFRFCASGEDWAKREVLRELIRDLDVKNAIIFCNRKKDVAILLKSLTKHGFNAGALHGDMDQLSRMSTLDKFRSGEIALLAASDVAARGLDIPDVSHVINFDVPWQPDDYVHRIGRTGRAGKEGFSATIVTVDDIKSVDSIARLIGEPPVWLGEPPDEDAVEESKSRRGKGRGRPGSRGIAEPRGRGRSERGGRPSSAGSDRSSQRPAERGPAERPAAAPQRARAERPSHVERAPLDSPPVSRDRAPVEARPERREAGHRHAPERYQDSGDRRPRHDREAVEPRETRGRGERSSTGGSDQPWIDDHDRPRRDHRPERTERPERAAGNREAHGSDTRAPSHDRGGSRPTHDRSGSSRSDDRRPPAASSRDRDVRDSEPRQSRESREHQPRRDGDRHERTARRDDRPPQRDAHQDRNRSERAPQADRPRADRKPSDRVPADNREPRNNTSAQKGLGDHIPAFLRRPVRAGAD